MKRIVVSAVNLRKGGTLTVLRQCLSYLSSLAEDGEYSVVALVHKRELADYPNIRYIELSWSIEGWGKRLWCEYVTMGRISGELGEVDLWLSLHDTTPRVRAKRQAVYCQTSFPFFRWKWQDFRFDPKIPLFGIFTRFAYQIGIRRNRDLIVQQSWLREEFARMFDLPEEMFVVSPPRQVIEIPPIVPIDKRGLYTFFFASTPDSHKNFETLCRATALLEERVGKGRFRTIITVSGDENKYARWLHAHWGSVDSLDFAGLMDKPTLYAHYDAADCFVFPSRIETWGLPISEYMQTKGEEAQMILSDLPYAHETSQGSPRTAFYPATDAEALCSLMQQALEGNVSQFSRQKFLPRLGRYADGWAELFDALLS